MMKTFASLAMVGALAIAAVAATPEQAEARRGGGGLGYGIAAGIIAGAALSGGYYYGYPRYYRYSRYYAYDDGCYLGPRQCRRVGGHCDTNRYGDTVCHGGTVRCYRATLCD